MHQKLLELQKQLDYTFKDKKLLVTALVHSSYSNDKTSKNMQCNERLEFLGDSVLGLVTAEFLYTELCDVREGQLSKIRASLVCEKSLSKFSEKLCLQNFLLLSYGERLSSKTVRPSILADAFEALIAAIYLDGGYNPAKRFILRFIVPEFNKHGLNSDQIFDSKSKLQEIVQQNKGEKVSYKFISQTGPEHDKTFKVQVLLNSNVIGEGVGKNKKSAEQDAASKGLKLMGY